MPGSLIYISVKGEGSGIIFRQLCFTRINSQMNFSPDLFLSPFLTTLSISILLHSKLYSSYFQFDISRILSTLLFYIRAYPIHSIETNVTSIID